MLHASPCFYICVLLAFLLTGCNSKKYLTEGQSFLFANKTTIKSNDKVQNKSSLYDALQLRYEQKETKTVFGIPRHTFYYHYIERKDKKPDIKPWSEERLINNKPVIYDSVKTAHTAVVFDQYLSLRGYRYANTTFKTKTSDKQTTVYYKVDPGPRMYLDTFVILADDPNLQYLIDSVPNPKIIGNGSPLDIELFNQEKTRIVRLIQNNGYATFDETYIPQLEVDTSLQRIKGILRVLNPTDSTFHLKYNVGRITIYPDYDGTLSRTYYDTLVNEIHYNLPDSAIFTLKPQAVERNVYLHPGHLTRIEDYNSTYKSLTRIDLIKFVNHTAYIDTQVISDPKINYTFFLSRNKKIAFGANAELTYANIGTAKKSLFGVAFNTDYRDLNTFKGAEVLNINLESGFEFNFEKPVAGAKRDIFNSVNLGVGSNLTFPRFMDPLGLYHILGYTKDEKSHPLLGRKIGKWLREDAVSRLSIGYNFADIQDLYQSYTLTANLSYLIQPPDPSRKLTIDRIGFDLFVPNAKPFYENILMQNKFLRESFGKKLFTGFIFRDYYFEFNTKSPNRSDYFKVTHGVEISGLEILAANQLENALTNRVRPFQIATGQGENRDTIAFAHFVKGEIDVRYFRDMGRQMQFGFRFNTGVATPFGPFTKQVPYVKQFFVGGALSNRAWQIRQLGPGSYQDPEAPDPNSTLPFYQTGDIKIDLSLEMRFKLPWYFQGVAFIDAANVWILNKEGKEHADDSENFAFNRFYKEFGIGYGYGLRLDFDFFILRLDVGYKYYNPYEVNGSHILHDELKKFPNGGEVQIAVGQKF